MAGYEFFKTRIHICHHGLGFSNSLLSWMLLRGFPGLSLDPCNYFLFYSSNRPFGYIFFVPIFTQKLFCFLYIWSLVCPRAFSSYLLVTFSFVILECPVLFLWLDPVSISFKSLFFHQYPLIYLFKLYSQACQLFSIGLYIPTCTSVFFLP